MCKLHVILDVPEPESCAIGTKTLVDCSKLVFTNEKVYLHKAHPVAI